MARNLFGGSAADVAETTDGARVPGAMGTVWAGPSATDSQVIDLVDLEGNPITQLMSDAEGMLPQFFGPDGVDLLYVDFGAGRVAITAIDVGNRLRDHLTAYDPHGARVGAVADITALKGNPGGIASLDTNGMVPVQQLPGYLDWLNVKSAVYGAKGDGIADDTAAIQNAINACSAAGGGTVYIPRGTYRITSALTLANKIALQGEGDIVTTIYQTNTTANGIVGDRLNNIALRDFRLRGPAGGTGKGLVVTTACNFLDLEEVSVTEWGSHGVDLEQPIVSNFTRVVSSVNGGAGMYLHGNESGSGTSISLDSCWMDNNTGDGYWFYGMTYCAFDACAADTHLGSGKAGYRFDSCSVMTLTGCGSEKNAVGVKFSGGGNHTVDGFFNYAQPASGIGFLVTSAATNVHLTGIAESTPNASASKWVQVDSGCSVTVRGSSHTTADQFAAGTTILVSNFSGVETVAGSRATGRTQTIGATAPLGDDGVGVLQLATASTVPSTNPAGGVTLYAEHASSVPLKFRDTSGNIRGLAPGYAATTSDQTSVGTAQTASTQLVVGAQSNATYFVEAVLYWTTANSATVTTSWTGPSGATMLWGDTTTGGDIVTTLSGVSPAWSTGTKLVRVFGTLTTTSSGSLTFTFASSVAASVTLKAGSYLFLNRIK